MAREGYFEKSALNGQTRKAVGSLLGGLKDTIVAGAGKIRGGTNYVADAARKSKALKAHPYAAAAAPLAVGAAGMYGVSKLFGDSGGGSFVPSMPSGSYTPESAAKIRDSLVNADSEGIYDHNKKFFNQEPRRRELTDAVARNDFNSGAAQVELQKMEADRASTTALRQKKFGELDSQANASEEKLKELNTYRQKMEDHKTSPWLMPYRGFLRMTGRDPNTVYNDAIAQSANEAGNVATDNYRINEMRRKMTTGQTEGSAKSRTPQQMQNDFFPSYNP
jgi:Spy/CpxP family protein refolding chaperone